MKGTELYAIFVANVDARLKELNWTRSDLAKKLNVHRSVVSQTLNGYRASPGLSVINEYATALRIEPSKLLEKPVGSN